MFAVKRQQQHTLSVAEKRMLHQMKGHTRKGNITNECNKEKVRVTLIKEKMIESRLRQFGNQCRPIEAPIRRVDQMDNSPIVRGRRRPRKTVDETMKKDLDLNDLSKELVQTS